MGDYIYTSMYFSGWRCFFLTYLNTITIRKQKQRHTGSKSVLNSHHFIELLLMAFWKMMAAVKQACVEVLGALTNYIVKHSSPKKNFVFCYHRRKHGKSQQHPVEPCNCFYVFILKETCFVSENDRRVDSWHAALIDVGVGGFREVPLKSKASITEIKVMKLFVLKRIMSMVCQTNRDLCMCWCVNTP